MNLFYIYIKIDCKPNTLKRLNLPILTLKMDSDKKYIQITTIYRASHFSKAVNYLQTLVKKLEKYSCDILFSRIQLENNNHTNNRTNNHINIHLIIENLWENQIQKLNPICEKHGYYFDSLEQFDPDSKPIVKLKLTETCENIVECFKKQIIFLYDLNREDFIISLNIKRDEVIALDLNL
jgi:hypothetical protein